MANNNNYSLYFPTTYQMNTSTPPPQSWQNWTLQPCYQDPSMQSSPIYSSQASQQPPLQPPLPPPTTLSTPPPPPPPPPITPPFALPNGSGMVPTRSFNTSVPPPPLPQQYLTNNYHMTQMYYRNWPQQQNMRKRSNNLNMLDNDDMKKPNKKRKKPLSQTVPTRKDWTMGEAQKALDTEKEYNHRSKNHLIIKFPDLELNRDIVSRFHSAIDSVHFQQPSTPRFCFVTLKNSVDTDSVISALNKTRFGEGYLVAEYKKDREEDQNLGPQDVDPLTLYVGNLGQEVTKDDIVNAFPKNRRIDIGYAKKMKFTRYAFVSFKCAEDALEAFKRTHNTQMFNKTLIVRFRRLHGTVGMPGEIKQNNPKRSTVLKSPETPSPSTNSENVSSSFIGELNSSFEANESANEANESANETNENEDEKETSCDVKDVKPDLSYVKREEGDISKTVKALEAAFTNHKPIKIKQEVKVEIKSEIEDNSNGSGSDVFEMKVKSEPLESDESDEDDDDEDDDCEGGFLPSIDFAASHHELQNFTKKLQALREQDY